MMSRSAFTLTIATLSLTIAGGSASICSSRGHCEKDDVEYVAALQVWGGGSVHGACAQTYTVVQGDTCTAIATSFGLGAWQNLAALNPSINSQCTNLQIGQVLCVLAGGGGGGGGVLAQVSAAQGTYYFYPPRYQGNDCQLSPGNTGDGYPKCASYSPSSPNYQMLSQLNSNNVVAIGQLYAAPESGRDMWCGKQVIVTLSNGQQVTPPDGGSFFVWDGCQRCNQDNNAVIDFSVAGLGAVAGSVSSACQQGIVGGFSYQITSTQIKPFLP